MPPRSNVPEIEYAHPVSAVSIAPPPCRMILIEVFKGDEGHFVGWDPVVGIACIAEATYQRQRRMDRPSSRAATHAELTEEGWKGSYPGLMLWPVVARCSTDLDLLEAIDERDDRLKQPDLLHRVLVPCSWPEGEDRARAQEIAGKLLANRSDPLERWAEVKPAAGNDEEAAS